MMSASAEEKAHRERRRFIVTEDEQGTRADQLLATRCAAMSRARIAGLIREGAVTLSGERIKPSFRVSPGDELQLELPPLAPAALKPQEVSFKVLYEDEELVVVDKPAGVIVHPGAGQPEGSLVHGLLHRFGVHGLSPVGEPSRPGIVHRIDQQTSGLLVVARREATHHALVRQFAAHEVGRHYLAIVWDPRESLPERGSFTGYHGRDARHRLRFTCRLSKGQGRPAVTHWRLVERLRPLALVRLRLETGRTHQIRVHMSEAGHPLLGDPLYGQRQQVSSLLRRGPELGLRRQALHAHTLSFIHPERGEHLSFSSPLPPELIEPWRAHREALWAPDPPPPLPDLESLGADL